MGGKKEKEAQRTKGNTKVREIILHVNVMCKLHKVCSIVAAL